jgi:hypothetical protein
MATAFQRIKGWEIRSRLHALEKRVSPGRSESKPTTRCDEHDIRDKRLSDASVLGT